ncbi:MAG: gliding motility-associated C-terminal domain-containing protein [Pedobacter sp.]
MFRLSLLLTLLFSALNVKPANFTVTSGADSGSGTLREALSLAAANGTTETDYIYFALTAGKISTTSPLILSSSLVIDGTSFPGAKLGISDAKVTIETLNEYVSNQTGAFNGSNINRVEIYGLCFSNFGSGQRGIRTINITGSADITVGGVGKGNIFLSCDYDIYMLRTNRIKISSNWFGITADKTNVVGTAFGGTVDLRLCDNIMLGGETKAEGNSWGYRNYGVNISGINPTTQAVESIGELCKVKNNNFGTEGLPSGIGSSNNFQDFKRIEIVDNKVVLSGGFSLKNISTSGLIQGNRLGLNSDMTKAYCYSMIELQNCNKIKIGGKNLGEANVMAYRVNFGAGTSGIYARDCGDILIERNSIYCVSEAPILYSSLDSKVEIPKIEIVGYNNGIITGTATPNAEIEIFSDGECLQCEAKTYLGTTFAAANGTWSMAVGNNTGYTASATLNNRTSQFLGLSVNFGNVVINKSTCGLANGSITGIQVAGATKYEWLNEDSNNIGGNLDISGLKSGKYAFTAYMGPNCKTEKRFFNVLDAQPKVEYSLISKIDASCNDENGSIEGLSLFNAGNYDIRTLTWTNELNEVKGNTLSITKLKAGTYTLKIVTTDDCEVVYGPVQIKSIGAPVIDVSTIQVTHSNCSSATGSIKRINVTGTGTISYQWRNEKQDVVGSTKDLIGMPAGIYQLEVKDESVCTSITTYTIPEFNGIELNEDAIQLSDASCAENNGKIGNISASSTDANFTYQWFDETNTLVSNASQLLNAKPGVYYLRVANSTCFKDSKKYPIKKQLPTVYPVFAFSKSSASCNLNNGSISITPGPNTPLIKTIKWVGPTKSTIGHTLEITGLTDGDYDLYLTDFNGCESFYQKYSIDRIEPLDVSINHAGIQMDKCESGKAAVTMLAVTGGVKPYTYEWKNEFNVKVSNQLVLTKVKQGSYTLTVTDASGNPCNTEIATVVISNINDTPPMPNVEPVNICAFGESTIIAANITTGTYRLYDGLYSVTPIITNKTGRFNLNIIDNKTLYMTYAFAECESERTPIQIKVVQDGIEAPTAFTPNGDGINDKWVIKNIEKFPKLTLTLFNRYGTVVFTANNYATAFDGTKGGELLPSGTYYYVIKLGANCQEISGSLSLLR